MIAARPALMDIGELVGRLAHRAPALARDLLPAGVRRGAEWCVAGADSPLGCSISVHLSGSRAGVWGAWAASKGGDALDLVTNFADFARYRHADNRSDKAAAIRWARAWLGLDTGAAAAPRPAVSNDAATRRERQAKASVEDKRRAAWRWWLAGTKLRPGDDAWDYLATRGIDLDALPRLPRALRTVRGLPNAEAGRNFPALIAAVVSPGGKFQTIHRTWLERQSDGRVLKAPVAEPKKVYGPCKGGTIRLARGASGKPWSEAPEGDTLLIAEGVENALSAALACPELRVAAGLNIGNLPHLRLPAAISTLVIAADADAPGSPAARTLQRAVARFLAERREVRIARVPAGFKDFNDYLLAAEAG